MDDYMFREYVKQSKPVAEATSYLEIFSYSDPTLNTVKEEPLPNDELENFLHQEGAFQPPILPTGVTRIAGLRMILQQNASHPETFSPQYISLKQRAYVSMVETMRLPYRGIESTSAVGPFFWAAFDQDEERPHLQILFRKSDVRKKGLTRGWELMLSHDMRGGMTMGYCKGTPSSDIVECVRHLKACALQIGHPMLLPTIIFSHDMSSKTDIKQREARDWLRKLEHAVSMRQEIDDKESYVDQDGLVDFDLINRHLVECHSQVLWKRPKAYMQILQSFDEAMELFKSSAEGGERWQGELKKLNASMLSRHEFYRKKLQGIDSYAYTTLQRLAIQRSALYNIIAQRESKLNFQMAEDNRPAWGVVSARRVLGVHVLYVVLQLPEWGGGCQPGRAYCFREFLDILGGDCPSDPNYSGVMALLGKTEGEAVRAGGSPPGEGRGVDGDSDSGADEKKNHEQGRYMGYQEGLVAVVIGTTRRVMIMIFMRYGLVDMNGWIAKFPILV
ncbi:hypothetical protein V495_02298 [Pseudogymnoascus sp. VKM F-4514 (FW-929)]|nr:hypothetical protein V490_04837 [Pseudogymnoascus sp. VKM F-3557]KFY46725.1 hypothetical protein V495_02298 [Pseudogymnoascus sp. VKM F-4514 (FW-929)]KFY64123.1 hypothetical protein V497_01825 [Pseudogymnoascus sp. VKM F-4516 (FW-969)]